MPKAPDKPDAPDTEDIGTPRTIAWLLVVAGEAPGAVDVDRTGEAFGDVSESELSGLATNRPAPPRLLLRAP